MNNPTGNYFLIRFSDLNMSGKRQVLSQYEEIRLDNIRQREEMLKSLNINLEKLELKEDKKSRVKRTVKKKSKDKAAVGEVRKSSRVTSVKVDYLEEEDEEDEERCEAIVNPTVEQRRKAFDPYITAKMDENDTPLWQCLECGKTDKSNANIMKHAESIHAKGVFRYKCRQCPEVMDTQTGLYNHYTAHSNKKVHD